MIVKKIIYIASMFDEADLGTILSNPENVSYAANKYNRLLCEGLAQNGIRVEAFALLPVTRSNCKKILVCKKTEKSGDLTIRYMTTVNLPVIKHILRCISSFFRVLFAERGTVVLFDLFAVSANIGMNAAAKIRRFERACIITDMPVHLTSSTMRLRIENKLIADATAYILLTEQMKERVVPGRKKAIVLEGHIDHNAVRVEETFGDAHELSQRIVLYAGALHRRYGIADLVDAFLACHKQDEILQLYGSGDYVDAIKEIAKENPCVQYCGVKPNSYIVEAEARASLLVNPRTCEGEYTKFSFPSKVLEYMVSGTPVLMAKLPGIPDEYFDYVYTFDDRDPAGLATSLRMVLDKDAHEIIDLGHQARKFVLKNKSNVTQAKKIVEWLQAD